MYIIYRNSIEMKLGKTLRRMSQLLRCKFIVGHWFFWHWRGQKFMPGNFLQTDLIMKLRAAVFVFLPVTLEVHSEASTICWPSVQKLKRTTANLCHAGVARRHLSVSMSESRRHGSLTVVSVHLWPALSPQAPFHTADGFFSFSHNNSDSEDLVF